MHDKLHFYLFSTSTILYGLYVCPKSLDPFYTATYHKNMVKTYCTYSINIAKTCCLIFENKNNSKIIGESTKNITNFMKIIFLLQSRYWKWAYVCVIYHYNNNNIDYIQEQYEYAKFCIKISIRYPDPWVLD